MTDPVLEPLRWAIPSPPVKRELRVRQPEGAPSGPPLLFVHGGSGGAFLFDEAWMPEAARRGFPAYAVSFRGHGASEGKEHIGRWLLRDYEHDLFQTIASLPEPPVLVGHSIGGLLVARILHRYPARAAILIAPVPPRPAVGMALRLALRQPSHALRILTGRPLKIDSRFYLPESASEGEARALDERLGEESALACLELLLPSLVEKARCPVLVVGSRDDALVTPRDLEVMARLTGGDLRLLDGHGHAPMLGPRAKEALDGILAWLGTKLGDGRSSVQGAGAATGAGTAAGTATPATTASRKPGERGFDGSR